MFKAPEGVRPSGLVSSRLIVRQTTGCSTRNCQRHYAYSTSSLCLWQRSHAARFRAAAQEPLRFASGTSRCALDAASPSSCRCGGQSHMATLVLSQTLPSKDSRLDSRRRNSGPMVGRGRGTICLGVRQYGHAPWPRAFSALHEEVSPVATFPRDQISNP